MKNIIVVGLLLISGILYGQKKVSGTVIDENDGSPLPGVSVTVKNGIHQVITDLEGKYEVDVTPEDVLVFSFIGYETKEVQVGTNSVINVAMLAGGAELEEVVVVGYSSRKMGVAKRISGVFKRKNSAPAYDSQPIEFNTEGYNTIEENVFKDAIKNPLSTFSIDVDAASYSNVRRFLNNGQMPPKDAVRIEEMINYFDYDYSEPAKEDPFSINAEVSSAPWNQKHKLVHIGLQGKNIPVEDLPAVNLVFLVDVSGSMSDANKLPLLKSSFRMLTQQLRPQDRVAIVVYAGAAGVVLPSTSGDHKGKILKALNGLQSGGSTAGGEGIKLAYKVAKENFIEDGNNRVILATDGDFNVGESSDAQMQRLIEEKRDDGIFLTALGFGMGNYKDSKMETLADKGNGNYAYIDNILEAKKVLVSEFGGTLFTIAKDVKIQVEFNPAKVKAYRLIGYENRLLNDEDFNDDKKDAGELGAGHTVTALYEIIPFGVDSKFSPIDDLKYQKIEISQEAEGSDELLTVKLRYKDSRGSESKLIEKPLKDTSIKWADTSENFRWSAAIASFGMLLRQSEYVDDMNYQDVLELAQSAEGKDEQGYRAEFIHLLKSCMLMARN
ncbi:vWA domain-containing protein [Fulvivirga sediminis]|uniref:von Willebrand factor type A domain-containing protein n=1 Tax=Fulvivirga sediminis TaxID=2803949 RepID=A0A937FA87_9BACT|nr:VWA domain-containing protein [Fulvivirga sediminis]MBL3656878.1 von Willebrand factor type A domain-containing protein [Fulvivirga sediminis]